MPIDDRFALYADTARARAEAADLANQHAHAAYLAGLVAKPWTPPAKSPEQHLMDARAKAHYDQAMAANARQFGPRVAPAPADLREAADQNAATQAMANAARIAQARAIERRTT